MNKEIEYSFVKQLEANQNIVHKICRLYTNDQDAHDDLFQEITIQLWRAFPKFRGDSKFSTWMYRVSLNTAITLYRKSKRQISTQDFENISFKIKSEEYDDTTEQQLKLMYDAVKKYLSFSVGSAITAKSSPEKEYEECLLKAKAMQFVLTNSIKL